MNYEETREIIEKIQKHYENLYQSSRRNCQPCGVEAERSQALKIALKALDILIEAKEEMPQDVCISEVTRLSVNELIPFEQVEPFKRLAVILDDRVDKIYLPIIARLKAEIKELKK